MNRREDARTRRREEREAEMKRLWKAWQDGASWAEVARLRGRGSPRQAQTAVRGWAKRRGLPLRNARATDRPDRPARAWELYRAGWTWKQVAEELGYASAQVACKAGHAARPPLAAVVAEDERTRRREEREAELKRLWKAWQDGASWAEVARLRGRGSSLHAHQAVRGWAKRRGLPLRNGLATDRPARAWELHRAGWTWKQVAEELGYASAQVASKAGHAARPPLAADVAEDERTRRREEYEAKMKQLWKAWQDGASWAEVARLRGHGGPTTAQMAIRGWAKRRKLPLRNARATDRPARAWELYRAGWTWKQVAEELGYSRAGAAKESGHAASGGLAADIAKKRREEHEAKMKQLWKAWQDGASGAEVARLRGHGSPYQARKVIRGWAKRRGLPLRNGLASDRPARGWGLRRAGWTWKQVAEELGYASAAAARNSVQNWERRRGLSSSTPGDLVEAP